MKNDRNELIRCKVDALNVYFFKQCQTLAVGCWVIKAKKSLKLKENCYGRVCAGMMRKWKMKTNVLNIEFSPVSPVCFNFH